VDERPQLHVDSAPNSTWITLLANSRVHGSGIGARTGSTICAPKCTWIQVTKCTCRLCRPTVAQQGQVSVISVAVASMVGGLRRCTPTCRFETGGGEFRSTRPVSASAVSIRALG
jgi:hypothetical protein